MPCQASDTSSGALFEMLAVGACDAYLNKGTFTMWRNSYKQITNFALSHAYQQITPAQFGGTGHVKLNRNADLVYWAYLVVDLPGITACGNDDANCGGAMGKFTSYGECNPAHAADNDVYAHMVGDGTQKQLKAAAGSADASGAIHRVGMARYNKMTKGSCAPVHACVPDGDDCPSGVKNLNLQTGQWGEEEEPFAYWANSVGQLICEQASIKIGGVTMDTIYSDFLFMWEELTGSPGKRLTEMIGKRFCRSELICDSRTPRRLYVPLPFWFTHDPGMALSLTSLAFHGVTIDFRFQDKKNLIVTSPNAGQVVNCATGCCLTNNDMSAQLLTTNVYLDTKERDLFASSNHHTIMTQTQHFHQGFRDSSLRANLNFNHPVTCLMWAIRRQVNEDANSWFNYSGIGNQDPMKSCTLRLNNQIRFGGDCPEYYRLVQPYQHWPNIPNSFIYSFSFALKPFDTTAPSGSLNFSRIDSAEFTVELQDMLGQERVSFIMFAKNFNILKYSEGLGGLSYSNFSAFEGSDALNKVAFA